MESSDSVQGIESKWSLSSEAPPLLDRRDDVSLSAAEAAAEDDSLLSHWVGSGMSVVLLRSALCGKKLRN